MEKTATARYPVVNRMEGKPATMTRTFAIAVLAAAIATGAIPLPASAAYSPGWQGAVTIDNDAGGLSYPNVAMDAAGNALAIWYQFGSLYYNRYSTTSGWGAAGLVETNDTAFARYPTLAGRGDGSAVAVWVYPGGGGDDFVYANRYNPATGWGIAVDIHPGGTGYAYGPNVAVNEKGDAVVTWVGGNAGGLGDIWATRFTESEGWEPPLIIDAGAGDVYPPRVVVDSLGDAMVLWSQVNGSYAEVVGAASSVGTGWAAPQTIERDDSRDLVLSGLAMSENGDAMAVWTQQGSYPWNILASSFTPLTGWQAPTPVESGDVEFVTDPHVAMDAFGNGCAVWWGQTGGPPNDAWRNCFEKGVGWGQEATLESRADSIVFTVPSSVNLAMDPLGNAIAVWAQSDGVAQSAWASVRTPSGRWGAPELLETDSTGATTVPAVAMGPSGKGIAIWGQDFSSRSRVMANFFVVPDETPPFLYVGSPAGTMTTNVSTLPVWGITEVGARVVVNGAEAAVDSFGYFSLLVALQPGYNLMVVRASDEAGNPTAVYVEVYFMDPVPALESNLSAAQAALDDSRAALVQLETQLNESQLALNATQDDLNATQDDVAAAAAAVSSAQAALTAAQANVARLTQDLAAAQANATAQQTRITTLEAQAAASNASAASAEASARSSSDQAAGASSLAMLGVLLGAGGIAVGALGLMRGRSGGGAGGGGAARKEGATAEVAAARAEEPRAPGP